MLTYQNTQKRKLISIATTEFERFLQLEDQIEKVANDIKGVAVFLAESVHKTKRADELIEEALRLMSYAIDVDKIASPAQLKLIAALHETDAQEGLPQHS